MFSTSTQKRFWTFADEDTLSKYRLKANQQFILRNAPVHMTEDEFKSHFLTPEEERLIYRSYENILEEFCSNFQPPMPSYVVGTAFHYFKRFYIHNSVMDYHPKDILITCAYLACKIEEFNVSIHQFIANLKENREKIMEVILNSELLVMSALKFHLTIHNPYRPVEGFFIDIKTRHQKLDPEGIRPQVEDFLKKVLFTDALLLYAPSQIALAAILHGASRSKQHLDTYVTDILITDRQILPAVIDAIRTVRLLVRSSKPPTGRFLELEEKLEKCRNQENNPESSLYAASLEDEFEEEELDKSFKGIPSTDQQPSS